MTLFIQNLKVAFRNLMKYKLQTLIGVLSIAVGIVTLAFAVSFMKNGDLPAIYDLPFADRIYAVSFRPPGATFDSRINLDIIRTLKQNGGLKCSEKIVIPTNGNAVLPTQFFLTDSSQRKGTVKGEFIDPEYLEFAGFRSAIDGKRITKLKPGQAIIGERLAEKIFEGKNPIGAAVNPEVLLHELNRLPNLDRIMLFQQLYYGYEEISRNPNLYTKAFRTYCTTDTALMSFLGLEVDWIGGRRSDKECLIIGDDLYRYLNEGGALENGALTMAYRDAPTLPIAGKFSKMPYFKDDNQIIAITETWNPNIADYVLIPKYGKAKALARSVQETIDRIEAENIRKDSLVSNFRNRLSIMPAEVETLRTVIGILSIVSLLICSMSIFSIIALETRSRLKEVAIRKVNGAKRRDIYRLFGKVYAFITLFALVVAIPVFKLMSQGFEIYLQQEISESVRFYPIILFLVGALFVIALIFAIVFWQIRLVMQTDPAKIIAKE